MAYEESVGPVTDYSENGSASFEGQEGQAHRVTIGSTHPYLGPSRQLAATLGTLPELCSLSAEGKPELSTEFPEQQSRSPGFLRWSPQEIAGIIVRVTVLVGIIWFTLIWTGIAVPTQSYQRYAIDFSRQPLLRGGASHPSSVPATVPRARLDLAIHLGLRNQPGPYDVVLMQDGMRYAFASGTAKLENHEPILRVKLDLSHVPAGGSRLGIRPAGWGWKYYKVILKATH